MGVAGHEPQLSRLKSSVCHFEEMLHENRKA